MNRELSAGVLESDLIHGEFEGVDLKSVIESAAAEGFLFFSSMVKLPCGCIVLKVSKPKVLH